MGGSHVVDARDVPAVHSVFVAIFWGLPASASVVRSVGFSELVDKSDLIVVARVTDAVSFWENGWIFTDVTLMPSMNVKPAGEPTAGPVVVRTLGGTVGEDRLEVSDVPKFSGERRGSSF